MIKVGIIGMGRMGNCHAPHLNSNPDAKVTVAFDPDPEKAAAAKEKYGVELAESAEQLINRNDVDAIFITSPTYCHTDALRVAMKTGKPVFCEKPVCRTAAECAELEKLEQETSSPVTIGFVRRYLPAQKAFHDLIVNNQLGTIRDAHVDLVASGFKRQYGDWFADFNLCGGVVLDMLSHHLDLLIWDLGPVKSVSATALLESSQQPLPADFAGICATFKRGAIAAINCAWHRAGRGSNFMEVYGDKGAATYSWAQNKYDLYMLDAPKQEVAVENNLDCYLLEDNYWIDTILTGKKPFVTLQDGLNAFRFADAILRAAVEQKTINL